MQSHSGQFLIAKPSLLDPNFRQTVVLLVQHNDEGAFGLVVNRPVSTINAELPCTVYSGGPCETQGIFLLHGLPDWSNNGEEAESPEIAPGIFLGDASHTGRISELSDEDIERVRIYAGCAGWGPGQLERELLDDAWVLAPADGRVLFETPVHRLWIHLRPPAIPQPSLN